MTVDELIRDLQRFRGDAVVLFTPREVTGGGIPEWREAHLRNATRLNADDVDVMIPTIVEIRLMDEVE